MTSRQGPWRRRRHDGPKFIQLFRYVLDSPAYISLSPSARAALIEVIRGYNGQNNGRIVLSVRDLAKRMGCHRNTATRVLQELVEKGFIEPRVKGALSRKFRHATEWRLTDRRCDATGIAQSQAFLKWASTPTPSSISEAKFKTRSQKLGPNGPIEQDTTGIQEPNPRSQNLGHGRQMDGPENPDTSKSTMHCSPQVIPFEGYPDGVDGGIQISARTLAVRRPSRRRTSNGECLARTQPWKAVGMSRSGWYAAGKPMAVDGDGLHALKRPRSTPDADRRSLAASIIQPGLDVLGNEVEAETARDDGIPEFLRRKAKGAAGDRPRDAEGGRAMDLADDPHGRMQTIKEEEGEWTL
jgi:hypothetical protein